MEKFPVKKRKLNAFTDNGIPIVSKCPHFNGDYLPESVSAAIEKLGGLQKILKSGDTVFIKPNFNCAEPTPLSTALDFLAAVIELLQDHGIQIKIGEMSGRAAWPTSDVIGKLKIIPFLKRYGLEFINFQEDHWIPVDINSDYWQTIHVPQSIYEADHRIYLPNMRCHSSARFTGALKLGVGWLSADDREILHADKLKTEPMIGEINLGFQSDLVIMDFRRSVTAWAGRGEYVYPNWIMASGDMVAIDTEGVKILKQFPGKNRIQIPLDEMKALTVAQHHQLGSMQYKIVETPANLTTRQMDNTDPAALAVINDP